MTDYSKFRTPFVEISIGDTKGSNMKPLPPQIARLIESVEIMETLCCSSFNQVTIKFNEGSREPFDIAQGSNADPSFYPNGGLGELNNYSGSLVDLKVSSGNKTSTPDISVTGLVSAGLDALGLGGAADALGGLLGGEEETPGKDNTPPEPVENNENDPSYKENIKFLLQERNQVNVTWGYREDLKSIRKLRCYIMLLTSEFPENGTPRTTIICHSAAGIADLLVPKNGVNLGLEKDSGSSESGKAMQDFEDKEPKDLIESICSDGGMECIVSDTFDTPMQQEGRNTQWNAGESLNQFFTRLARRYNAIYRMESNPTTGKDTVIFINKKEWQKYPIYSGPDLYTYRGNGSIIKSINIKADYGSSVGTFMKSINEEGGKVSEEVKTPPEPVSLFESIQNTNPIIAPEVPTVASFADKISGGVTGNVSISAESSPAALNGIAKSETSKQASRVLAMDFNTLGYPQLTPGTIKFGGIGKRYSGFYNVQQVTHTINSNGYNCSGVATSFTNGEGGVVPDKPNEKVDEPEQVEIKLFESQKAPDGTAKQKYNKEFIENGGGADSGSTNPNPFANDDTTLGISFGPFGGF